MEILTPARQLVKDALDGDAIKAAVQLTSATENALLDLVLDTRNLLGDTYS